MYTTHNFKTKKALRQAVADHQADPTAHPLVRVCEPGPFRASAPTQGTISLEVPHFPLAHRWYAIATLKDGIVVSIK